MGEIVRPLVEVGIPSYSIRSLLLSDTDLIEQASAIYDESLGQKYIPVQDLVRYISKPEQYVVLGSISQDKLLGALIGSVLGDDESSGYDSVLQIHESGIRLADHRVGLVKSVAVEKRFRHCGIGTHLTEEAMRQLKKLGCGAFFAVSWVSNKPDSSQGMFEKLNYRKLIRLKNYWTQDSIEQGYDCPNCGSPCFCSAIYYFLQEE